MAEDPMTIGLLIAGAGTLVSLANKSNDIRWRAASAAMFLIAGNIMPKLPVIFSTLNSVTGQP